MKLVYRPAAISDLQATSGYIENTLRNPQAANRLRKQVLRSVSLLRENPHMGVSLRGKLDNFESDIRMLVVSKQLVFYELHDGEIEIIRILDGRADYLSQLFEELQP